MVDEQPTYGKKLVSEMQQVAKDKDEEYDTYDFGASFFHNVGIVHYDKDCAACRSATTNFSYMHREIVMMEK